MSDQINTRELNDDCEINITMANHQWNTVADWLAHSPYQEAKEALTKLNEQIQKIVNDPEKKDAKEFTGTLPIKTFNMLIFALGQAPYYVVAEIIQTIYTQGQNEIKHLREQAAMMPEQEKVPEEPANKQNIKAAPVEKSEQSTDNTNKKTKGRRSRTKKSEQQQPTE